MNSPRIKPWPYLLPLPAAEKIPYNNSYVASSWCTAYPWYPCSPSCASVRPDRPYQAFLVHVDAGFGPEDPGSGRPDHP